MNGTKEWWNQLFALEAEGKNRKECAKILGITPTSLWRLMVKYPESNPFSPMSIKERTEQRWGIPFEQLLIDIAYLGFNRKQAAAIIGVPRDALVKSPDFIDVFDDPLITQPLIRDEGKPLSQILQEYADKGFSLYKTAMTIGYRSEQTLKKAMQQRNITVVFPKKTVREKTVKVKTVRIKQSKPVKQTGSKIPAKNHAWRNGDEKKPKRELHT